MADDDNLYLVPPSHNTMTETSSQQEVSFQDKLAAFRAQEAGNTKPAITRPKPASKPPPPLTKKPVPAFPKPEEENGPTVPPERHQKAPLPPKLDANEVLQARGGLRSRQDGPVNEDAGSKQEKSSFLFNHRQAQEEIDRHASSPKACGCVSPCRCVREPSPPSKPLPGDPESQDEVPPPVPTTPRPKLSIPNGECHTVSADLNIADKPAIPSRTTPGKPLPQIPVEDAPTAFTVPDRSLPPIPGQGGPRRPSVPGVDRPLPVPPPPVSSVSDTDRPGRSSSERPLPVVPDSVPERKLPSPPDVPERKLPSVPDIPDRKLPAPPDMPEREPSPLPPPPPAAEPDFPLPPVPDLPLPPAFVHQGVPPAPQIDQTYDVPPSLQPSDLPTEMDMVEECYMLPDTEPLARNPARCLDTSQTRKLNSAPIVDDMYDVPPPQVSNLPRAPSPVVDELYQVPPENPVPVIEKRKMSHDTPKPVPTPAPVSTKAGAPPSDGFRPPPARDTTTNKREGSPSRPPRFRKSNDSSSLENLHKLDDQNDGLEMRQKLPSSKSTEFLLEMTDTTQESKNMFMVEHTGKTVKAYGKTYILVRMVDARASTASSVEPIPQYDSDEERRDLKPARPPERTARTPEPVARPPERAARTPEPVARPPERAARTPQPVARPPDRTVRQILNPIPDHTCEPDEEMYVEPERGFNNDVDEQVYDFEEGEADGIDKLFSFLSDPEVERRQKEEQRRLEEERKLQEKQRLEEEREARRLARKQEKEALQKQKEEQQRIKDEQLKKERDEKEKERKIKKRQQLLVQLKLADEEEASRVMFKVAAVETTTVIVRMKNQAEKFLSQTNLLSVRQGEEVEVLRTDESINGVGRVLIRKSDGKLGYVERRTLDLPRETDSAQSSGSGTIGGHAPPLPASRKPVAYIEPEDEYEAIDVQHKSDTEIEEDIYEDM